MKPKKTKISTTKNRAKNETERKCFVPNCVNKKMLLDNQEAMQQPQRLHFFQVPDGIEGLFWEKSVKIQKRKYDKIIDLLSSSTDDTAFGLETVTPSKAVEYCCELHFDIEADVERITREDGTMDFRVKPGAVPQIKPNENKMLLCDYYGLHVKSEDEFKMEIDIKKEPMTQANETNGYVSLVDISTLTHQNEQIGHGIEHTVDCQPMSPLTIAMMKRKSLYYMGLQPNQFLQVLELAKQNGISDVKVMVTLRKRRLNEEFEALGDLFDLDKTTTERYFEESQDQTAQFVDNLCTSAQTNYKLSSVGFVQKFDDTEDDQDQLFAQLSPKDATNSYAILQDDDDDDDESSEASSSYKPSEVSDDSDSVSDEAEFRSETKEWFTSRGLSLHFHLRTSLPSYLNKTTCGLCLQKFDTKMLLLEHKIQEHDGNAFRCDVCNKCFHQRRQIYRHILFSHAESKTFLCDLCGKGFPYPSDLTVHLQRTHSKLRRYECHSCDYKYKTLPALKDHVRAVHSQERPFICTFDGCGRSFSRKNVLWTHRRSHSTDKFDCNMCSKRFSLKWNLNTHKRNIHGMVI